MSNISPSSGVPTLERKTSAKAFAIKDPVPSPEHRVFPIEIVHKGNLVRIVEIPNRGITSFTVVYHSGVWQKLHVHTSQ